MVLHFSTDIVMCTLTPLLPGFFGQNGRTRLVSLMATLVR